MKLLATKYKTHEGALKRCRFENALAKGEFDRGDKAQHYRYAVVQDNEGLWRVARAGINLAPLTEALQKIKDAVAIQ